MSQQHETQLEQSTGVWQVAHDVSLQPHVWHADDDDAAEAIKKFNVLAIATLICLTPSSIAQLTLTRTIEEPCRFRSPSKVNPLYLTERTVQFA
jgi:hypothetical protein